MCVKSGGMFGARFTMLRLILMKLWGGVFVCALVGCMSPSHSFHQQAADLGFSSKTYKGKDFIHQVYINRKSQSKFLHIYLGGDGTPWEHATRIASDPTPRNPIMLRAMALDPTASIYLGRPCYHGLSQEPQCRPKWWTSARYSETVVESLGAVLTKISKEHNRKSLVLFGYSGGATLAMLLAQRLPFVHGVVTVAGNLDIQTWTDYHAYSPLAESLNPALLPRLGDHIVQLHFFGSQDELIPPHLAERMLARQGKHSRVIINDVDHRCCWEMLWPRILREAQLLLGRNPQW